MGFSALGSLLLSGGILILGVDCNADEPDAYHFYKLYHKENDDRWLEDIWTRQLSIETLPDWARDKLNSDEEVEITEELERELYLKI